MFNPVGAEALLDEFERVEFVVGFFYPFPHGADGGSKFFVFSCGFGYGAEFFHELPVYFAEFFFLFCSPFAVDAEFCGYTFYGVPKVGVGGDLFGSLFHDVVVDYVVAGVVFFVDLPAVEGEDDLGVVGIVADVIECFVLCEDEGVCCGVFASA